MMQQDNRVQLNLFIGLKADTEKQREKEKGVMWVQWEENVLFIPTSFGQC